MHRDILTANQVKLLPLVKEFSRDYYLVGGTAATDSRTPIQEAFSALTESFTAINKSRNLA